MQLVKAQILQGSLDENVRNMWKARTTREAKLSRHFRASQLCTTATAQAVLDTRVPTQDSRLGLGHGKFKAEHTPAEMRKLVSNTARSFGEEKRMQHAQELAQQATGMLDWLARQHHPLRPVVAQRDLRPQQILDQVRAQRHRQLGKDSRHTKVMGLQANSMLSAMPTPRMHFASHHQQLPTCTERQTVHMET